MTRNMILSGGVAHDYSTTSPILRAILQDAGIESEIHEDFRAVEDGSLQAFDMLTLNCVRWTCNQTPDWRKEWHFELSSKARHEMLKSFAAGHGMLALHCATICFDDWPEFRRILGAWWDWGHSGHAPLQQHRMHVRSQAHPITQGLTDFDIEDELYTNPRVSDSLDPLIDATWENVTQPILWLRNYGKARVCYNAMGHGVEAFSHPANRLILQRAALWVRGKLESPATAQGQGGKP
jgi:uncharacterized protein